MEPEYTRMQSGILINRCETFSVSAGTSSLLELTDPKCSEIRPHFIQCYSFVSFGMRVISDMCCSVFRSLFICFEVVVRLAP